MENLDPDLVGGLFDQSVPYCFHRSLDVRLENNTKVLDLAFLYLVVKILQGDLLMACLHLPGGCFSHLGHSFGLEFIRKDHKRITCKGYAA